MRRLFPALQRHNSPVAVRKKVRAMELPLSYNGKTHVPVPSGKFVVGCTDLMVGPTFDNGCFLRLYYPSHLTDPYESSSEWPSWIPHPKYVEGYTIVLGMIPFLGRKLISWAFGNTYTPIVKDAAPKNNEQQFPVMIFSHGLTGCRTAYSVFCSEIASHGFVVAAIEHRDGSASMTFDLDHNDSSEKWIPYVPMKFEKDDMPLRQEQLSLRVKECQKALDLLIALNNGADIDHIKHSTIDLACFKGMMDPSSPAIAGHSFGSATLLRTLAVDKRFKMGVAMDAWMWPLKDEKELHSSVDQPLLFINMEAFQTAPNLKSIKRFVADVVETERRVVTLKGSVHKNQVDLPFLLPPYLRRLAGASSVIDPRIAMELNNRITLLYLRKHLGHPVDDDHSHFVGKHADLVLEGIE